MDYRPYDPETDLVAARRIWHEVGWIDKGNDSHDEGFKLFSEGYDGLVATLNGEPECYVATGPGSMRYLGVDLPYSVVAAVTTSHVARRQGLAKRLTAAAVAQAAAAGAQVSALGMFDQGFYNRLGFGTGGYEHWLAIDPAHLEVPVEARTPIRLGTDDWEKIHGSRLARRRGHGGCTIDTTAASRAEMLWASNGFGLGYADGPGGELTHHIWFSAKDMENGPLSAWWMSYQSWDQFLELMALLANLGDQVQLVRFREPAGIQLQDLIRQPFRRRRISMKSEYETASRAAAYWQIRICDLEGCVGAVRVDGDPVRFNLSLADPIADLLDDAPWRGVGGDYVVELGTESSVVRGTGAALPTLTADIGAFSRLWFGVLPATGLAVTDELAAPAELLGALDRALRLPPPKPDWDF
jgi:GNAT superfamily N-acetyltransferase